MLRLSHCDNLAELPENLGDLKSLEELNVEGCERLAILPKLPSSLLSLNASNCKSLVTMMDLSTSAQCSRSFVLMNCTSMDETTYSTGMSLWFKYSGGEICMPGSRLPDWIKHSATGSTLNLKWSCKELPSLCTPVLRIVFGVVFAPPSDGTLSRLFPLQMLVSCGVDIIFIGDSGNNNTRVQCRKFFIGNPRSEHVYLWEGCIQVPADINITEVKFKFTPKMFYEQVPYVEIKSCGVVFPDEEETVEKNNEEKDDAEKLSLMDEERPVEEEEEEEQPLCKKFKAGTA